METPRPSQVHILLTGQTAVSLLLETLNLSSLFNVSACKVARYGGCLAHLAHEYIQLCN